MTEQHTHIWTTPNEHGTWTCVACTNTAPTCIVRRPSDDEDGHPSLPAQAICDGCLRHEQGVLDDTADALGHWQHQPRSLVPAIRYDRDKVDGSRTANDRPTIQTPADILDVLWSWADMWADTRGDTAAGDVLTWLKRHLLWAANNAEVAVWGDYRTEIRQMRHHARRVSGLLPQRQAAPCIHCGGQIVQDWADENWQPRVGQRDEDRGLSDTVRCTSCDLTWPNRERWMYANGHTLQLAPEFAPNTIVTLDDARTIYPHVPAQVWWKWRERNEPAARAHHAWQKALERGQIGPAPEPPGIPTAGTDTRGNILYRIADLTTRVEEWQTRADTRATRRRSRLAG